MAHSEQEHEVIEQNDIFNTISQRNHTAKIKLREIMKLYSRPYNKQN